MVRPEFGSLDHHPLAGDKMTENFRKTGIAIIDDVRWGTHFCQFYQTKEDLVDILVPYFASGLENNEFCIWITSQPMREDEAKEALRKAVPHVDQYIERGQLEIISYEDWYLMEGTFDSQRVLKGWIDKLDKALANGYDGMRLTGNTFWLEQKDWKDFVAYEEEIDGIIGKFPMLALCSYSLDKCRATEVIDVINHHQFALIKQEEKWTLIENSKHKIAMDRLQESEEQQRKANELKAAVLNSTHVMIACMDADFNFITVNRMYAEADGREPEFFPGKNHFVLYPSEENEAIFRRVVATGEPYYAYAKPFEYAEHPGRGVSYWDWSLVPVKDDTGTVTMIVMSLMDVTKQIEAQQAVRESEEKYRSLFNRMTEGFALHEIIYNEKGEPSDYRFLDINPAFERYTGLKQEDLIGRTIYEVLPHNDPYWVQIYGQVARTGEPIHFENYSSALNRHFEVFAYCPSPHRFATIFMDITERKQTEEALRRHREYLEEMVRDRTIELEERNALLEREITERMRAEEAIQMASAYNRSLIEASLDPLVTIDADGKITDVNTATENITGHSRGELVGTDFSNYFTEPEKARAGYLHVFSEGSVHDYLLEILHRDGHVTPVLYNATVYHDAGGNVIGVFAAARDITERRRAEAERKRLEDQLIQLQKMEALGRFAGGIAHDLNNILYPVIIDTEYLLSETLQGTSIHQILKQILDAAYRERDLVKQILSFSRRDEQKLSLIRVTPVVKETLNFIKSSLPSTIEIKQHIDAPLDTILGDPTQVHQIIMNLCRNAADALDSQNGIIEVALIDTYLDPISPQAEAKPGHYLQLSVRDTGCGIPSEAMDRIFEPFFTTKEVGKGSGMGLSVIHGIIKSYGGTITVESQPGKGSLFTVYLPLYTREAHVQTSSREAGPPLKTKETILLIDDEEIILSSLKKTLERSGYGVVAVEDGLKAVEIFSKIPDEFDLVITDLKMPKITGVEAARRINGIRSDIPVILCTGVGEFIDKKQIKTIGIKELLLKPTSTSELKSTIQRVLEG